MATTRTLFETQPIVIWSDADADGVYTPVALENVLNVSEINSFQVNHLDDGSTTTNVLYIGMAKDDGTYVIKKFDETTSALPVLTYATISNNPGTTTYSTAWTNRSSLVYDRYETAF